MRLCRSRSCKLRLWRSSSGVSFQSRDQGSSFKLIASRLLGGANLESRTASPPSLIPLTAEGDGALGPVRFMYFFQEAKSSARPEKDSVAKIISPAKKCVELDVAA